MVSVTHSCGHSSTPLLRGDEKARQRQIVFHSKRPCPDCFRDSQAELSVRAAAANKAAGYHALRGTPKQVAFAEHVRLELISKLEALGATDDELAVFGDWEHATWWLDIRRRSAKDLLAGLRKRPTPKPEPDDIPF